MSGCQVCPHPDYCAGMEECDKPCGETVFEEPFDVGRCPACQGIDQPGGTSHLIGCPNDDEKPELCTCTIACIPQGLVGNQVCRLR